MREGGVKGGGQGEKRKLFNLTKLQALLRGRERRDWKPKQTHSRAEADPKWLLPCKERREREAERERKREREKEGARGDLLDCWKQHAIF